MATARPPAAPVGTARHQRFKKTGMALLLALAAIFIAAVIFSWITGDAAVRLSSLRSQGNLSDGRKTIVRHQPLATAETLAPQAKSKEEVAYAREAQRLGDHEVDQAFASAMRQANLQRRAYAGDALALSQRITQLQKSRAG